MLRVSVLIIFCLLRRLVGAHLSRAGQYRNGLLLASYCHAFASLRLTSHVTDFMFWFVRGEYGMNMEYGIEYRPGI